MRNLNRYRQRVTTPNGTELTVSIEDGMAYSPNGVFGVRWLPEEEAKAEWAKADNELMEIDSDCC